MRISFLGLKPATCYNHVANAPRLLLSVIECATAYALGRRRCNRCDLATKHTVAKATPMAVANSHQFNKGWEYINLPNRSINGAILP